MVSLKKASIVKLNIFGKVVDFNLLPLEAKTHNDISECAPLLGGLSAFRVLIVLRSHLLC